MNPVQSSMLMGLREWSGLQLLHCFRPRGRCVSPRALLQLSL